MYLILGYIVRPSMILLCYVYYIIGYLFCLGWVISRLVSLGLRSLIGLVGLSVGLVGLSICIFVCWWGWVFGYTSCSYVLGLVRYILLRLLRVGFSFL